jgi:gas vesicle protein
MRTVWLAVAGAAVGAGVAVLMSPAGRETRLRAKEALERCTLETQDRLATAGRRLRAKAKTLEQSAEQWVEQGKELAEVGMAAMTSVQSKAAEGKDVIDHGKEVLQKAKSAAASAS